MNLDAYQVRFDNIAIGMTGDNAGIFVGNNGQCDWRTENCTGKSGFGTVCGSRNELTRNRACVIRGDAKSGT